jgi:hypothetical protein
MAWWRNQPARAVAAVSLGLVVAAATEQLGAEFGGLEPLWRNALIVGAVAAGLAWLLAFVPQRPLAVMLAIVLGAGIWTVWTFCTVAGRYVPDFVFGESALFGGALGLVCVPIADAMWLATGGRSADEVDVLLQRAGILSLVGGAIVFLFEVRDSPLPDASLIAGALLIAASLFVEQRRKAWIARMRCGQVVGWSIRDAAEGEEELPPLWAGDRFAEQVVVERVFVDGGAYRSSHAYRAVHRVSVFSPRGPVRRQIVTLAALVIATLGIVQALRIR